MEQKFDGSPKAEIRLDGRRFVRGEVANDWGLQLRWVVRQNGKVVATAAARAETTFEPSGLTAGSYEVVLQMWKYVDYKKTPDGEFVNSKFIDISAPLAYQV